MEFESTEKLQMVYETLKNIEIASYIPRNRVEESYGSKRHHGTPLFRG